MNHTLPYDARWTVEVGTVHTWNNPQSSCTYAACSKDTYPARTLPPSESVQIQYMYL